MAKVIVIGAGPAGIMAAITASKNHEVILLDGEDKILKKILLTGNGKCNFWNSDINYSKYHSYNSDLLKDIFTSSNIDNTYKFLENIEAKLVSCLDDINYYLERKS